MPLPGENSVNACASLRAFCGPNRGTRAAGRSRIRVSRESEASDIVAILSQAMYGVSKDVWLNRLAKLNQDLFQLLTCTATLSLRHHCSKARFNSAAISAGPLPSI